MAGKLAGKVAIVTGAGRGIGRGIALLMAKEGCKVVANDLGVHLRGGGADRQPAQQVVDEIKAAGGEAIPDFGDVSNWPDAEAMVGKAIETYGKLDILVNVAGILQERMIFNMTEGEWDEVIRVNLKGNFCTTHFASIHWRQRRESGRLINFTSDAGIEGATGQPNYAAAKAGIIGFTKSCANALVRYGVTCNCISPSAATRMTDESPQGVEMRRQTGKLPSELAIGKEQDPANVAPLVVYLASDEADYISGRIFGAKGWRYTLFSEMEQVRHIWSGGPWDIDQLFQDFHKTLGEGLSLKDLPRAEAQGVPREVRQQSPG